MKKDPIPMSNRNVSSKFLSLVLRHKPETIGIQLDDAGWVTVDELLAALKNDGRPTTRETLEDIVRTNDKQRFAFSEDGLSIRANQGHSVAVELQHAAAVPPEILFHGTPEKFVEIIRREGLNKMKRHHVHLHEDQSLASSVGQRRGRPIVLRIESGRMHDAGIEFFVTPNNVWLTDHVPPEYIVVPEDETS